MELSLSPSASNDTKTHKHFRRRMMALVGLLLALGSFSSCLSRKENALDPMLQGYLWNALMGVQPMVYATSGMNVYAFDALSLSQVSSYSCCATVTALAGDPLRRRLFIGDGSILHILDTQTGQYSNITLPHSANVLAYDSTTGTLFAAKNDVPTYSLSGIDATNLSRLWTVTFSNSVWSLAALPGKVVVGFASAVASPTYGEAYDGRSGEQLSRWAGTFSSPSNSIELYLSASPDSRLLVSVETDSMNKSFFRVHDPETLQPTLGPIDTGYTRLVRSAVNPVDGLVYVSDDASFQYHVFSLDTGAKLRTSRVLSWGPASVGTISYSRYLNRVYVAGSVTPGSINSFDARTGEEGPASTTSIGFTGIAVYPGDRY